MHQDLPYTVISPPLPCRVHAPEGVWHGLLLGRYGDLQLVLHGPDGFTTFSWLPDGETRVVGVQVAAPV